MLRIAAAIALLALPLHAQRARFVPDPDGPSAFFQVHQPIPDVPYEVQLPAPTAPISAFRIRYDHTTVIPCFAGLYDWAPPRPADQANIICNYWLWRSPAGQDDGYYSNRFGSATIQYAVHVPALEPGDMWSYTASGSHPFTLLSDPWDPAVSWLNAQPGPVVSVYLVATDQNSNVPGTGHGYQWWHETSFDLDLSYIQYQDASGVWYTP